MNKFLLIGLLILAFTGAMWLYERYRKYQIRKQVKYAWGQLPRPSRTFDDEKSLKKSWELYARYHPHDSQVDELTWNDLDVFSVFQQLNATYSSIGAEALYQRLRSYNFSQEAQLRLESLILYFNEHPDLREQLQTYFAFLGKKDHNYVEVYLNETENKKIAHFGRYVFCGLLPLLTGFASLFFPITGLILITLSAVVFNGIYYQIKKQQLQTELSCMSYFVQAISTAKKLAKLPTPLQGELQAALRKIGVITILGFSFRVKANSEAEVIFDYLCMLLMLPFIAYHLVLSKLVNFRKEADQLWRLMGELEVAAAVLNFRLALPETCQPFFTESVAVLGKEVYHPLLAEAVPNDVNWQMNTLVSGSNASGKSTYVKSVALSCLLAATVHTAIAKEFSLPHAHVFTSMAIEDDLFEGDSYFIAEIKSLKRILNVIETKTPCLCFIDEILKGTNTVERVAASASIIAWLKDYPALAFVATHDLELTEILDKRCQNVHFEEQIDEVKGIIFDYRLKEGASQTSNAIKLLHVLDYPPAIITQAKTAAAFFAKERRWIRFP